MDCIDVDCIFNRHTGDQRMNWKELGVLEGIAELGVFCMNTSIGNLIFFHNYAHRMRGVVCSTPRIMWDATETETQ